MIKKLLNLSVILFTLTCCSCQEKQVPTEEKFEPKGLIAYEAYGPGGSGDILVHNLETGKTTNLTSTWKIGNPSNPAFSPDGRRLAFQGRSAGHWNIYLYDLTTGELPVCLTESLGSDNEDPVFTPDGASLIFIKNKQIAELNIGSGTVKALTFEAGASYASPAVSPDGKTILYSYTVSGKSQIGKLDIAALSASSLAYDLQRNNSQPVFAGEKIVYTSRASAGSVSISSLNPDGSQGKSLWSQTGADGSDPCAYSSDILLISSNKSGSYDIYALGINSGRLTAIEGVNDESDQRNPAWSGISVEVARPADGGKEQHQDEGDEINSDTERPVLKGRMVYHNYTSYTAGDSQMYIYDFSHNSLTNISKDWKNVSNMMNGHFSPDGKYITFMGVGTATGSWDIFLYDTEAGGQPVNLTPDGSYRDEDPKFSYSGKTIAFKRNDRLAEINVADKALIILSKTHDEPYSMPYYSTDDSKLLVGAGEGAGAYIGCWDIASSTMTVLADRSGITDYYPINIDKETFYFSSHYSVSSNYDQLYKGFWSGAAPQRLAFNKPDADYSDAFPIGKGWLLLVSTKKGGQGAYDIYIAHETSGAIYSLNLYNSNINTSKNELGQAYCIVK